MVMGHPLRSLRSRVPLHFVKGTVVLRYGYRLKVWFDGVREMAQEPDMEYRVMDDGDTDGSSSGEMAVLATPGDRLLSYIVDVLIVVGIAILGGILGVILALVVVGTDELERLGESFSWGPVLIIVIPPLVLILGFWLFVLNMVARDGQSPGKKVLKVRIVNVDGSDWGWGGTLVREILSKFIIVWVISTILGALLGAVSGSELSGIAGLIVSLLLFIWIVMDEKNQTLHDKIANTYVVKVE